MLCSYQLGWPKVVRHGPCLVCLFHPGDLCEKLRWYFWFAYLFTISGFETSAQGYYNLIRIPQHYAMKAWQIQDSVIACCNIMMLCSDFHSAWLWRPWWPKGFTQARPPTLAPASRFLFFSFRHVPSFPLISNAKISRSCSFLKLQRSMEIEEKWSDGSRTNFGCL